MISVKITNLSIASYQSKFFFAHKKNHLTYFLYASTIPVWSFNSAYIRLRPIFIYENKRYQGKNLHAKYCDGVQSADRITDDITHFSFILTPVSKTISSTSTLLSQTHCTCTALIINSEISFHVRININLRESTTMHTVSKVQWSTASAELKYFVNNQ